MVLKQKVQLAKNKQRKEKTISEECPTAAKFCYKTDSNNKSAFSLEREKQQNRD